MPSEKIRLKSWPLRKIAIAGVMGATALLLSASGAMPAKSSVPLLGGRQFAWGANYWDWILDPPPGSGHGPIRTDRRYPYNSQIQNGHRYRDGELQVPIVDTKDPILKPWAAKEMQATNDELLSGKRKLPFVAQSRCWPGGVPGQDLFLEPTYFIQTPKQVYILWQRDSLVRHIRMNAQHPAHVKPSWFGDSVGHYENDDTLVVDTIGIAGGGFHYIGNFRTPHTDRLHVVERFTVSPDKQHLTAIIKVEDPGTFNAPLTLRQIWRRENVSIEETVCAADGGVDRFGQNLYPIPVARTPDF
jgi:hypothetical protein